ncbi:hypothetical protein V2T44_12955 [Serratia ficaria]|uniref:hypothetical protein n=1 Tax=Serratia ficaria TaxID=61651 RepID=UPI002ED21B44|nr:hypothetical protein [Serratia ficaria]
MAIALIVSPRSWLIKRNKKAKSNRGRESRKSLYNNSIVSMLFSAVCMLGFVFSVEFLKIIEVEISFAIVSFLSMFLSGYYFISNSEGYSVERNKTISWAIRIVFILLSFSILSWAKGAAMGYMDLTYNDASSRMIIYAYVLIISLIVASPISGMIYMVVCFYEIKVVERVYKKGGVTKIMHVKYNSWPITIPLVMITTSFLMCYGKYHKVVDSYIVRKSIESESTKGFWCGNGYKALGANTDARFIKLSDKDYRAFIFKEGEIRSYRLSCLDSYPYYKMKYILTEPENIRVQMKIDEISHDIKNIGKRKG